MNLFGNRSLQGTTVLVLRATLAILCTTTAAAAFEVDTHARITSEAWSRFVQSRPTAYDDLGIVRSLPNSAGAVSRFFLTDPMYHAYDEDTGSGSVQASISARYFYLWEAGKMYGEDDAGNSLVTSILGQPVQWLMQGVVREDDLAIGPNPLDDPIIIRPLAALFRVANHFYDPVNKKALNFNGSALGATAPDWAIGRVDEAHSNDPDPNRYNRFSAFDAREAMFRALTGTAKDGTLVATTEQERNRWWATTFRALGDVMHLVQDMAQPQHTRNDWHSGIGCPLSPPSPAPLGPCLGGHKSVLEQYFNNRATNAKAHNRIQCPDGSAPSDYLAPVEALPFGGVAAPSITSYGELFYSATRSGLADYTNRGFFTVGTNLGENAYTEPSNTVSTYVRLAQSYPLPCNPATSGQFALLYGSVPDTGGPSAENVALTAESMWAQFTVSSRYTMVRTNYDDMAELVFPRAAAYSASLLQYFFRGRMELSAPDEGIFGIVDQGQSTGFKTIKLKVKNVSDNSEAMSGGRFVAVIRYRVNTCYAADLSGEYGAPDKDPLACRNDEEHIVISNPSDPKTLGANEVVPLTFDFSAQPLPLSATDLYLQVVYRGPLGTETDAVAVSTLDVAEPTSFVLMNNTDYLCVNGTFYPFHSDSAGIQDTLDDASATAYLRARNETDDQGVVWEALRAAPYGDVTMQFAPGKTVAHIDGLPPQRFARVAFLTDQKSDTEFQVHFPGFCSDPADCDANAYTGAVNQADYDRQALVYTKVEPWRGILGYTFTSAYLYTGNDCDEAPAPAYTDLPTTTAFPVSISGF